MSKPIQVSDDTYNRLKEAASKQFRPLGSHIDFLLALEEAEEIRQYETRAKEWEESQKNLPDAMQSNAFKHKDQLDLGDILDQTKQPESNTERTPKEIMDEISQLHAKLDAADPYNQDPDYWADMDEAKERIDKLWESYRLAGGEL